MAKENEKFVQEMLRKAQEKSKATPQTRFEGIDQKQIEGLTKNIQEQLQKGKKRQ